MNLYHLFIRVGLPPVVCFLLPLFSVAQTVLFEETMGVPTMNIPVGEYTGFDNYGSGVIQYSSGSTTDVRSSSASDTAYYSIASGGGNIFINDTNEDFQITGIAVGGYSAITLSFGLWKGSIAEDGSNLTVEVTIDGGAPVAVPLVLPTGSGTAVWHYQVPLLNLPAGNTLSLRFNGESNSAFRIDDILITGTASPTPVVLRSFNAFRQGRNIQLVWETAQEKNSAFYEVQRSRDGQSFYTVARVPSRNDPLGWRYTFTDQTAFSGRNYYRLRMTDFDGKRTSGPVRMVTVPEGQQVIRLVQNPVRRLLKLKIRESFDYAGCRLYSIAGRLVPAAVKRDGTRLTADVAGLQPGVYVIAVEGQAGVHTLRFLKL